jgi:Fe-S cluster assembly scaffold protein SufB
MKKIIIPKNKEITKLIHLETSLSITLNKNSNATLFLLNPKNKLQINLQENSDLRLSILETKTTIININIILEKTKSKIHLQGLFLANKVKQDININITHNAPNTLSIIETKAIVKNNSFLSKKALIKINKHAKNSEGHENLEVLLLNKNSEVIAIPNLEIQNKEVKSSHSVSIANIQEEKLYYLMTRGLNKSQAINQIIKSYISPILRKIKNKKFLDEIKNEIK